MSNNSNISTEQVLIDVDGVHVIITKDDPWYNELSQKWGEGRSLTAAEENDFNVDVDYDSEEL